MSSTGKAHDHTQSRRHGENEVREMVSKLTRHLTSLGHGGSGNGDSGLGIITLAGDNKGATMKAGPEELIDTHGVLHDDDDGMSAYTNSNYQAVNNSIMLGGSCTADDPGVHVVISDFMDEGSDGSEEEERREKKRKKKEKMEKKKKEKKKKEKESSKKDDAESE